ncbi:MAG: hypothetical protein IPK26_04445 [Planctomycetes bacterium]|nr:hypothetical protein [Planctomycetota bacterium]
MKTAIIELEEGSLTLTIARLHKKTPVIHTCFRMPLSDIHGVVLANTLKALVAEIPEDFGTVHVLLGERRMHHFVSQVPVMQVEDLQAFVTREAMRVAGLQTGTELLAVARFRKRLSGRRMLVATTVLPKNVWEPLAKAFAESGIKVASLHSIEDGLAAALGREHPERTAVMEQSANKARFVLVDNGGVAQVRRFIVPGMDSSDGDTSVLAAQLAMEVPRTLDYLKEINCPPPTALVVSHRVRVEPSDLEMFKGEVAACSQYGHGCKLEDGQAVPGMATLGLLRQLSAGRMPPSLTAGISVVLPTSPMAWVAAAAAVVIGFACGALATVKQGEVGGMQAQLNTTRLETERLEREIQALASPSPDEIAASPEQIRLGGILAGRRPFSRLLATMCATVPKGVLLEDVQFTADDRVQVTGIVEGESRLASLLALSAMATQMRAIEFLAGDGKEDVAEVEGGQHRMRFKFTMNWRHS